MYSRLTLLVVTLFWLTMTYLLWQSEYVGHDQQGSPVPVELVWRKIMTAPDNSSLEIMHRGKKAGYCRWSSTIGQELSSGRALTDDPPIATNQVPAGDQLSFEGNVAWNEGAGRLGWDFALKLGTNHVWDEFDLRLRIKPTLWEIQSRASEQSILLVTQDQEARTERVIKFSDLQNPQVLMREFDAPTGLALLGALGAMPKAQPGASIFAGLKWKARNDWITIGHTTVRAYCLEGSLLERYRMRVIVSRVGEILRVDLPDGWELVNDQLTSL